MTIRQAINELEKLIESAEANDDTPLKIRNSMDGRWSQANIAEISMGMLGRSCFIEIKE